jgi:hypothetical protein
VFTDKTCWAPHEQQLHAVQPPQQDPQWQDEETWPRILIQTWQKKISKCNPLQPYKMEVFMRKSTVKMEIAPSRF